jgi:hypothetical protein
MSAPDTTIKKQRRRHLPALLGIVAAAAFGVVMFLMMFNNATDETDVLPERGVIAEGMDDVGLDSEDESNTD